MKILGIETSCDETSIAVLEANPSTSSGQIKVLSNIVSSQVKIHSPFGGVVPSLAAREHEKNLPVVFKKALKKSKTKIEDIDLIALTIGPGLEIALWRGINFAKQLSLKWKKPLIPVNHLEGHIYSNFLKPNKIKYPILNLIVSGGHTQLVLMTNHGKFKIVGETQDDAAGEAFDKVSKMLKLGYPGGPIVSARADKFQNPNYKLQTNSKIQITKIKFPRPMINSKNYNFSFSGLKTAVLYKIREIGKLNNEIINEICYEFQQAVIDVLVQKTIKAAKEYKIHPVKSGKAGVVKQQFNRVKSIFLSGGVSANKLLRKTLEKESKKIKAYYSQPDLQYTGDNAAMIALAGFYKYKTLKKIARRLKAEPNLKIKNWIG